MSDPEAVINNGGEDGAGDVEMETGEEVVETVTTGLEDIEPEVPERVGFIECVLDYPGQLRCRAAPAIGCIQP